MFKNMKLSMKITAGFSVLLFISLVMGVFAWQGLSKVLHLSSLNERGIDALTYMNQCATTRRDFAIQGFNVQEGQTKNAAEQFRDAQGSFANALSELNQQSGLRDEERRLIAETQRDTQQYLDVFGRTVAAQQGILDAFAVWRQNGNTITQTINEAIDNVLEPEQRKAHESNNFQGYTQ